MKDRISNFEIEKIREQYRLGKSVIDISKHLGIRKRIIEEILKTPEDTPPPHTYLKLRIKSVEDLKQLIITVIERLENKAIEPKVSNSIFYGCSLLSDIFKTQELKDLEKRLVKIEEKIKCRR